MHLEVQETRIWSLDQPRVDQEDSTCHRVTRLMNRNYWAYALEPGRHSHWSPSAWRLCSVTREANSTRSPCTTAGEQPRPTATREKPERQQRPSTDKNKWIKHLKTWVWHREHHSVLFSDLNENEIQKWGAMCVRKADSLCCTEEATQHYKATKK